MKVKTLVTFLLGLAVGGMLFAVVAGPSAGPLSLQLCPVPPAVR